MLEHIAEQTEKSKAKAAHAKLPPAEAAEGERAITARTALREAAEREARPVEMSVPERARVQKVLDELRMPPREQVCVAATRLCMRVCAWCTHGLRIVRACMVHMHGGA